MLVSLLMTTSYAPVRLPINSGARFLQHYLAGIQYALGDLKADDTPSGKLAAQRK